MMLTVSVIASLGLLTLIAGVLLSEVSETSEVRRVQVNGTDLAYIEKGTGEPVVFIHGAISDYRMWLSQVEVLSRKYRAVSYSRRHHYPNAFFGDASDYTRKTQAEDLATFLRSLNLGPAHLVGHSYGGSLAVMVAAEHPELVRSLVLGEPSLFALLQTPEEKTALVSSMEEALAGSFRQAQRGEGREAVRSFIKLVMGADVFESLPESSRAIAFENARTLGPMLKTYFDPNEFDCDRIRRVRAPALIVRGESSPVINHYIADALKECLLHSHLFVLPKASHGLQMEKPEEFYSALLEFLRREGSW